MDDEILKPIFVPKAARKARSNSGVKKNQSDDEKRKLERVNAIINKTFLFDKNFCRFALENLNQDLW
jgi:hypothetical protein